MEMCNEVCFFGTAYKTTRMSVVDAYNKTRIRVCGVDGCRVQHGTIKTYPQGFMICSLCDCVRRFDANNKVYSVRNGHGSGELLIDGLVCQNCYYSDEVQNIQGARFAELCHEDTAWIIQKKSKEYQDARYAEKCVKKWRSFVQLRKERRRLVRDVSLVLARKVENCNPTPVLDVVVRQFNEMHCMCK